MNAMANFPRARDVCGIVRVAVSANMAQYVIVPSLPELVARHPGLTIDFLVNGALADMSRDGIDIAIRTGSTQTDEVVAKQISSHGRQLYVSPAYLKKHGEPKHPMILRNTASSPQARRRDSTTSRSSSKENQ